MRARYPSSPSFCMEVKPGKPYLERIRDVALVDRFLALVVADVVCRVREVHQELERELNHEIVDAGLDFHVSRHELLDHVDKRRCEERRVRLGIACKVTYL